MQRPEDQLQHMDQGRVQEHAALMTRLDGFALVERDWVRRNVPGFEWHAFETASPRQRLEKPLSEATIALVSTSGARLPDQPGFDTVSKAGDPSSRVIPADTPIEQIVFDHPGYDVRKAYADPDCVFPLRLLHRYAAEGRIGSVAARAYSIMGYITQTDVLLEQTGPAIADALDDDGVDLAFLVPA